MSSESTPKREKILEKLRKMEPYDFELLVADLWRRQGWDAEVTQESGDMGVDVEAVDRDGFAEHKAVIQAKRYQEGNKIGRPKIQQYYTLREQDPEADMAIVVTTSAFTSQAEEWASDHNVKLVDGRDLESTIVENGWFDLLESGTNTETQEKDETSRETENAESGAFDKDLENILGGGYPGFTGLIGACTAIGIIFGILSAASSEIPGSLIFYLGIMSLAYLGTVFGVFFDVLLNAPSMKGKIIGTHLYTGGAIMVPFIFPMWYIAKRL
jgi:hypothetical protein